MARATSLLFRTFDFGAKLALLVLLFNVAGNVVARAVFSVTDGAINLMISGSIEIASIALIFLVFSSLPGSATSGAVKVDIFTSRLPKSVISFLDGFFAILMAGFGIGMTYQFFFSTLRFYGRGDATQDLELPLYLIYGTITIACLGLVIGIALSFRSIVAGDQLEGPES